MKTKFTYPAIFEKEAGGYFVQFPDISPCYTEGSTLEEAVIMAKDVLESRIETALEKGEPLPVPSDIDTLKGDRVMLIVTDKEERLADDRGGHTAGNPLSAAKQREAGSPAVHTPPRGQLPCLFCYLCSVLFIKRE